MLSHLGDPQYVSCMEGWPASPTDPCPVAALVVFGLLTSSRVEEAGEATRLPGGGEVSAQGTLSVQDLSSTALTAEEGPGKGMGSIAS